MTVCGDGEYDPRSTARAAPRSKIRPVRVGRPRGGRGSSIYKFDLRESSEAGLRSSFPDFGRTNKHDAIDMSVILSGQNDQQTRRVSLTSLVTSSMAWRTTM